jgi:DNA-binding response OmpR family regulator
LVANNRLSATTRITGILVDEDEPREAQFIKQGLLEERHVVDLAREWLAERPASCR